MNVILAYISQILQDNSGVPSSKRWVALVCLLMVIATWASNLWFHYKIEEFIYDSFIYLIIGCLGISGVEKFAPTKKPTETSDSETDK